MRALLWLFISAVSGAQPGVETARTPEAPSEAFADFSVKPPVIKGSVQARPLIVGDLVPDAKIKSVTGGATTQLSDVLSGKRSVLIFGRPETFFLEQETGSFKTLVPYLHDLGYELVVIATNEAPYLAKLQESYKYRKLFVDVNHRAHLAFHLMDKDDDQAPAIQAIYLVDEKKRILFNIASVTDAVPFSGEVLVLAARVYKDFGERKP